MPGYLYKKQNPKIIMKLTYPSIKVDAASNDEAIRCI